MKNITNHRREKLNDPRIREAIACYFWKKSSRAVQDVIEAAELPLWTWFNGSGYANRLTILRPLPGTNCPSTSAAARKLGAKGYDCIAYSYASKARAELEAKSLCEDFPDHPVSPAVYRLLRIEPIEIVSDEEKTAAFSPQDVKELSAEITLI